MPGLPEGFIEPTLGNNLGNSVMKAYPTPQAIAGAVGTMSAEIVRHREYNAKKTGELILSGLPGEMTDNIEIVLIKADKFTTVPLRASNLDDPKAPFYNELSLEQQIALADLRERFRKNEHGADTPITMWEALSSNEQHQLVQMGVLYVEQLAAYKEHEYYKLGNQGPELVKRAQRHLEAKKPNKQEDFERNMAALLADKAVERERADAAEKAMFAMQERLAALESGSPVVKRGPGRPARVPAPGVQESSEG